jgi:hypothetical protein
VVEYLLGDHIGAGERVALLPLLVGLVGGVLRVSTERPLASEPRHDSKIKRKIRMMNE